MNPTREWEGLPAKSQNFAQKKASRRNWLKFQIIGIPGRLREAYLTTGVLTAKETCLVDQIQDLVKELLKDWEQGSIQLGMSPKLKNRFPNESTDNSGN